MIVIDANLLLYSYDDTSPYHAAARQWLETTFSEPETVGLSWVTLLAFVRITTSPRPLEHPLTLSEATEIVDEWLTRPTVTILHPGARHWEVLRDLMQKANVRGPLVSDAHLAALAIEHGATLASADRDFARFPGLRFLNPLRSA
jgi:toxin-antitoxin system PIN domain toxin